MKSPQQPKESVWLGPALAVCVVALLVTGVWWWLRPVRLREEMLAQARNAMSAGDHVTAELLLQEALAQKPDDSETLLLLAQNLLSAGDSQQAVQALERYPDDGPKVESVRIQQARILLQSNRPGGAEAAARRGLRRHPESIPLQQTLLDIFVLQDRRREARQLIDGLWLQAKSRSLLDRIWVLSKQFDLQFGKRDTAATWPILQAFAHHEPDNVSTFVAMAKVRLEFGEDVESTMQRLRLVIEQKPFSIEAVETYLTQLIDRSSDAEDHRIDLLEAWPEELRGASYFRLLGSWRLRNRQLQDAEAALGQAVKLEPFDWKTMHQLGSLRVRLSKNNPAQEPKAAMSGNELIQWAGRVREAEEAARPFVKLLREWLDDPNPDLSSRYVDRLPEIAERCAEANVWDLADRWLSVLNEVDGFDDVDQTAEKWQATRRRFFDLVDGNTQ